MKPKKQTYIVNVYFKHLSKFWSKQHKIEAISEKKAEDSVRHMYKDTISQIEIRLAKQWEL